MRRSFNIIALKYLMYNVISVVFMFMFWFGAMIVTGNKNLDTNDNAAYVAQLVSVVAASVVLMAVDRPKKWFKSRGYMSSKGIYKAVVFMIVLQIISTILMVMAESLFNMGGLTLVPKYLDEVDENNIWMILYSCIIAPICEELCFRGFLLSSLKKYGKVFSVVSTALLFSLFHGNPIQGINAFILGLFLGYIALNYGLKWAMVFHALNNIEISFISSVTDYFGEESAVGYALNAVVAVAVLAAIMSTIFIIVRNADKIGSYMSKNGSGMGKCFVSMLCSVFIISILYGLYTFITSVGPM